ncbi:MAG: hypothetical protein ACJAVI_002218 [Candidatus Azotimanducaceae bacterium]|jgi:hypothetical protein
MDRLHQLQVFKKGKQPVLLCDTPSSNCGLTLALYSDSKNLVLAGVMTSEQNACPLNSSF